MKIGFVCSLGVNVVGSMHDWCEVRHVVRVQYKCLVLYLLVHVCMSYHVSRVDVVLYHESSVGVFGMDVFGMDVSCVTGVM